MWSAQLFWRDLECGRDQLNEREDMRNLVPVWFGGVIETIFKNRAFSCILVHAISAKAKRFYEAHGFAPSPIDPMTLMITLSEATKTLLAE